MKRRTKSGRSLERLIATIEKVLSGSATTSVESPKRVPDRVTGSMREHDVFVTIKHAHHEVTIAIECRDRSRKVTLNDVESFVRKCEDTGVDHPVIVSPKGFTKTALAKAAFYGVRTLTLVAVGEFDWLVAKGVGMRSVRVVHIGLTVDLAVLPDVRPQSFTLAWGTGKVVTERALAEMMHKQFRKVLQHEQSELAVGPGSGILALPAKDLWLIDDVCGKHAVVGVRADVKFEVSEKLAPFRRVEYGFTDGRRIASVAVADIDHGPLRGKVVMQYDGEHGGTIAFVAEGDEQTSVRADVERNAQDGA